MLRNECVILEAHMDEERKEYFRKWRKKNREALNLAGEQLRAVVFEYYGNKCDCCGEDNDKLLTIDYIDGTDGDKKKASVRLWSEIIEKDFPKIYQLLCYNCSVGRAQNDGVCPHKSK